MVRHLLRDFERGSRDVCSSKIEMKKQPFFLVSVVKKCASDDIEWRIVISQELPLPRLIHLLIRPFDMIQFYIQSLIYGDRHSSLRGGDTVHINTQNMQILLNRYQCDVNIQICNSESQHWIRVSWFVCRVGGMSVISLMSWSFRLQCPSFVRKTDRRGEGEVHQIDSPSHQNIIWQTWYFRAFLQQFVTDHFTLSPSSQHWSEISKLNK